MAHRQQINFCLSVKNRFPDKFKRKAVLDVGSLDINGNNRYLFSDSSYVGVDLAPGRNVDMVCRGHELKLPDAMFDVVISTECFEHDMYWELTLNNCARLLKPGGLFLFSCATTGRPEHGTRRTTPKDAPLLPGVWADYYMNLTEADILRAVRVDEVFELYAFEIGYETCDLYFWGVKK